jgi:hypothetical protein
MIENKGRSPGEVDIRSRRGAAQWRRLWTHDARFKAANGCAIRHEFSPASVDNAGEKLRTVMPSACQHSGFAGLPVF